MEHILTLVARDAIRNAMPSNPTPANTLLATVILEKMSQIPTGLTGLTSVQLMIRLLSLFRITHLFEKPQTFFWLQRVRVEEWFVSMERHAATLCIKFSNFSLWSCERCTVRRHSVASVIQENKIICNWCLSQATTVDFHDAACSHFILGRSSLEKGKKIRWCLTVQQNAIFGI